MKKNILVLYGSPRVGGNSYLLADAFVKGAIEAEHEVVKYEIRKNNFKGCIACNTCFSKGAACSFNCDFNDVAPVIEKADVIVFATPVYWFTFPAQLKVVIDKLYSFIIGERKLNIKESVLLACGEENTQDSFEPIISTYKQICSYPYLKWTDRGQVIVPGVLDKGDILSTDYLAKAEDLGHSI